MTTQTEGLSPDLLFGSKLHATNFINKIYFQLFGLDRNHPQFNEQLKLFSRTIGCEEINLKILEHLSGYEINLVDQSIGPSDLWEICIRDNCIQSVMINQHGKIRIVETPDMRALLRKMFTIKVGKAHLQK